MEAEMKACLFCSRDVPDGEVCPNCFIAGTERQGFTSNEDFAPKTGNAWITNIQTYPSDFAEGLKGLNMNIDKEAEMNKGSMYWVAAILRVTEAEAESGAVDSVVLSPTAILAASETKARERAALLVGDNGMLDRTDILVRPF
jgi:hypothetical protein